MKAFTTVAIVLCAALPLLAQRDFQSPVAQISIARVDLADAASDHLLFNVSVDASADRNLRVHRICFEGMRLGGVPVYMGTIEGPIDLRARSSQPISSIPLTVYYRDLDSLSPIIQAVSDGQLSVDGYARVEFELNLFQKIALRQWSGRSEVAIHDGVPLSLPGGEFGKLAAIAGLRATDMGLHVAGSALASLRQSQIDWTQDIGREYTAALILAETRYSLVTNDGRTLDLVQDGVGFRIPGQKFVLTAEMLNPWRYNPEVAGMLQNNQARLVSDRFELSVWPGNVPVEQRNGRTYSQGAFRVIGGKEAEETIEIPQPGGYDRVRVARRDSPRNFATFQFTNSQDASHYPMPFAPNNQLQNQEWDRVALFRFSDQVRPELVFVQAHRSGNRLVLDTPIDENAFGSPVLTPRGAIAMVQGERSGTMLTGLF